MDVATCSKAFNVWEMVCLEIHKSEIKKRHAYLWLDHIEFVEIHESEIKKKETYLWLLEIHMSKI